MGSSACSQVNRALQRADRIEPDAIYANVGDTCVMSAPEDDVEYYRLEPFDATAWAKVVFKTE